MLAASARESDVPRSPCGSALAIASPAEDSRNAATADEVVVAAQAEAAGMRDHSAARVPVQQGEDPCIAAANRRRDPAAVDVPVVDDPAVAEDELAVAEAPAHAAVAEAAPDAFVAGDGSHLFVRWQKRGMRPRSPRPRLPYMP